MNHLRRQYNFSPASPQETIVFGAARPGSTDAQVNHWLTVMQAQGIQRVCCLLPETQLSPYSDLLVQYRRHFGPAQVCWAPIADFQLASPDLLLQHILPFLALADRQQQRVVVHCAGGIGRTGQVLAAWLIARWGFSRSAAIQAVRAQGRNPYEAVLVAPRQGRNPWKVRAELHQLLDLCHSFDCSAN